MTVRSEVTRACVHVPGVGRPDNLPLRVLLRDLVLRRYIARPHSFACARIAVAKGIEVDTR